MGDIKVFPRDCRGCEHLKSYDMSIDDWTSICMVNRMQIDDCDEDYQSCQCPEKREK